MDKDIDILHLFRGICVKNLNYEKIKDALEEIIMLLNNNYKLQIVFSNFSMEEKKILCRCLRDIFAYVSENPKFYSLLFINDYLEI
jgi:hypothetical protein